MISINCLWEWAVSADEVIWGSSYMYTTSTFTQTFTTADTFFIRVRFCDNDGQWGAYYTFTIEIVDCKRYYYVKDHPSTSSGQVLGNIRQIVDENGVIISAQDYSPYGEVIRSYNNADANDKYKFTEKERDKETNLDYFGARYYDAGIWMWLSLDAFSNRYPSISPYTYCVNNPLILIDENGDSLEVRYYNDQSQQELLILRNGAWINKSNGQAYTSGTNTFADATINAINEIAQGRQGNNLIEFLATTEETVTITNSTGISTHQDLEIFFNPNETKGGVDINGSPFRSSFIGLAHELGHAKGQITGREENGVWHTVIDESGKSRNIQNAEKYAMSIENKIRIERNIPQRVGYTRIDNGDGTYYPHPFDKVRVLTPLPSSHK